MVNLVGWVFFCVLALFGATESKDQVVLQDFKSMQQLRSLGYEFADYFQNATLLDLGLVDPRIPTQQDLQCLKDLIDFSSALTTGQLWALKMIDSWGSLPSGILAGNFYDLGNYDECLNINAATSQTTAVRGKYCFLSISPIQLVGIQNPLAGALKLKIATCFPASCSASHMDQFIGQLVQRILNLNISSSAIGISESTCQTIEREPHDALTICIIVILSVMASVVLLFTLYDYLLCHNQEELPILVKVFSARVASRALFRVVESNSNPNVIDCLNGIRCMSLFWVVYAHEYSVMYSGPVSNFFYVITWSTLPYSSFIQHGFFSVDSFLFLGGLLVSLISLRLMEKSNGKLNVPLMYLHRIIRILPLLAIAIPVYMKIMPLMARGPLFHDGFSGLEACESNWFWSLLFVQNYINDSCLGHTWYLGIDMQLFILSPIFLIALYKWGKKAAAGVFVLMLLCSGCLFATQMVNNYSLLFKNFALNGFSKLYSATHTHAAPWLIGFLFGYFLHLNRGKKFQLNWMAVWSGWILCLAMIFTSIFALYPASQLNAPALSIFAESSYYTLTRIGWPLSLCWVVFACMQGYGGLANSFLSSPLWQPLSRLSYSIYMWHPFMQEINTRSVKTSSYFSDYRTMQSFWFNMGFTLLMSYVFYLIIEAPFAGLDLLLKPRRGAPRVRETTGSPNEAYQSQPEDESSNNLDEVTLVTPTDDTSD
ncbi:hypothetical protein KR018_004096 [Drosophila ironensis]|nr:hypothetical protein KR018_004096 [Drosophila ironensis]